MNYYDVTLTFKIQANGADDIKKLIHSPLKTMITKSKKKQDAGVIGRIYKINVEVGQVPSKKLMDGDGFWADVNNY